MTCPTNPEHGRVYDLSPNRWYCPHSEHYQEGTRRFFSDDEVFSGHELRRPVAPARRTRRARK